MSWSSPVRVLGVCGVWLAVLTGCGGTPEVAGSAGKTSSGGTDNGGSGGSSTGGGIIITGGGENNAGGGDTTPTMFVCGNGKLEPGEFCDDGNTKDNDGCSGDCKDVNLDYDCSVVGQDCVKVVICGDGVLQGTEVCDDGNTTSNDGCSDDCTTVEDGWVCVRPGKPCVAVPVCGNGVRERGEACDDGQSPPAAGDGCDDKCQLEAGFFCPTAGKACVAEVCGDGVRTPTEECDDAQMPPADGDGCSHTCTIESGFRCNASGCEPICGDGVVVTGEGCDDGNRDGGDGCSGGCVKEPFYNCTGQPSVCTSSIACGNGVVEPGEVCDPPGTKGCKAGCKSFDLQTVPPVCNNGTIEEGEGCEPANPGHGCSATCQVETGWTCPQPHFCFENPFCGDSVVTPTLGEACDPPNVGMGCSATCKVEAGWTCVGLGPSTCVKPVCGNGIVDPGEQCDDNNTNSLDGCSSTCTVEAGWACPNPGATCVAKCGDGKLLGLEKCDDGNKISGDGCNAGCKIEVGFKCPTPGAKCVASVCGDQFVDVGEGCDDGGKCSGGTKDGTACTADATCTGGGKCLPVAGDGCGPTCQHEPTVTVGTDPVVNVICGDGIVTSGEVCDDGNTNDGDGCQADCKSVTPGFTCSSKLTRPASLQMQVTHRDFKANGSAGGHPHFENVNEDNKGIAGAVCTTGNTGTCGRLDAQGKPQTAGGFSSIPGGGGASTDVARYATWYRDTNTLGFTEATLTDALTLNQIGGANSDTYQFSSSAYFPIDGRGDGNTCGTEITAGANGCCAAGQVCVGHNYSFTTELRYFFQFQGGETLTFQGDDDVWVFINGRLAVDVGGVHCAEVGRVTLGDQASACTLNGTDYTANYDNKTPPNFIPAACPTTGTLPTCNPTIATTDARFGLTKGKVYEIVLFHAERHTDASNFTLTLAGFLAPRSSCDTICGDGRVLGDEFCDDGDGSVNDIAPADGTLNSDTASGACNTTCTARSYCGDGVQQTVPGPLPAETCDDGTNITLYKNPPTGGACAPGCKAPANCGDGTLQAGQGELCDLGTASNTGAYGGCTNMCKLGGYCGDGIPNGNEVCDLGANNGKTYGPTSCGYDCKEGPHCGDGIPNDVSEECDKGALNGQAGSGCDANCKDIPGCGDGKLQTNLGEQCDYGQFASNAYGGCTNLCKVGPHCGDANTDKPYEECDDGANNNDTTYDGCTKKCALGPHCGDAVLQSTQGEFCDNGFNDDDYQYTPSSCGPDCMPPPGCGDGVVQANHELCDAGKDNSDTAYLGCTTACVFGPYCGDGHVDPQGNEACDKGPGNVSYAAKKGGCSYDCQPAPYCGDGERNGPEQCDLGVDKNTGDYGTCNPDCTFGPRCGDGHVDAGEQCDDGAAGSLKCTVTCKKRDIPA